MTAARWLGALLGAILIVLVGGACVNVATGFFLDPMWNAPYDDDPLAPPPPEPVPRRPAQKGFGSG